MAISPLVSALPNAAPMPQPQPVAVAAEAAVAVTPTAGAERQAQADTATSDQSRQDARQDGSRQTPESAVEEINHHLQAWATNLRFEIDPDAKRLVVSVVDAQSGDVLRTVPSEAVIRMAKMVASLQGQVVDTTA